MLQEIVVYFVLVVALGATAYYIRRKLRALKRNTDHEACSECPLKKGCQKKL